MITSVLLVALPAAAQGRSVYVTGAAGGGGGNNVVSVIDTATNTASPDTVPLLGIPYGIAITPDGTRAYATNTNLGGPGTPKGTTVTAVDTSTNQVIGSPITVADLPAGIAITPDGSQAYVASLVMNGGGTISVIDTQTNSVTDTIGPVPGAPLGVAITPDGSRAYVTMWGQTGSVVAVIDTGSNELIDVDPSDGDTDMIAVGGRALIPGITPNGNKLYVPIGDQDRVKVIDTNPSSPTYNTVTATIAAGVASPWQVAVTPDGTRAYATSAGTSLFGGPGPFPDTVAVIDTSADAAIGSPITVGSAPTGVAFTPDGAEAYAGSLFAGSVYPIDTSNNQPAAGIGVTGGPLGVAMTPDQGPTASFTASAGVAGSPTTFDATASADPDGTVASYDWDFGDSSAAPNGGPTPSHTYGAAGTYTATLTVTDNEGTSTQQVFTGQTVSRNGSSAARATRSVAVGSVPGAGGTPWAGPPDTSAPVVVVKDPKSGKLAHKNFKQLSGTSSDPAGVSKVEYAISSKVASKKAKGSKKGKKGASCRYLTSAGKLSASKTCDEPSYLAAQGTTSWSAKLKKTLPKASYTLYARATDTLGNTSEPVKVAFKLT